VVDSNSALLRDLLSIYKPFHILEYNEVIWTTRVKLVIQRDRSELLTFWLDKGWFNEQDLKIRATELAADPNQTQLSSDSKNSRVICLKRASGMLALPT
jgi:hypothetical protein